MLFDQYHPQELLTPSINDGGVNKLNFSLTSLDFFLLDDINAYLPPIQKKKNKKDLINDNNNDNNQHLEEFFSELDFSYLNDFDEKSDFLSNLLPSEDLDIEKWISLSSFPSPPMDINNSCLSSIEDTSSTLPWIGDEYTMTTDMIVPLSPPTSVSPEPVTKKGKLSVVERRLRKKGQNKTAAEKYRIKKKSERNHLLDQHLKLKNINSELKSELENLTYRVQQFKQLFVDVLQINLPTSN